MFKKWVEEKSQQQLSGADRKKLKRAIKERFHHAYDPNVNALLLRGHGWIDEDHKRMKKGGVHVLRSVEMEG
ncbi:hypothetical protein RJ639_008608 [Escallonia herrerae]|uniref:Uncharacterized protein n=1 Tax=Escallonia herrerae TaxID=1293975 RepID=A0AA88VTM3_9ASTE|nr:hypothetical protein RJ639_008608 [Escallonia herrerae]